MKLKIKMTNGGKTKFVLPKFVDQLLLEGWEPEKLTGPQETAIEPPIVKVKRRGRPSKKEV